MQQDFMRRRSLDREPCAIAQALEVLGDWWTLLIVRDAFLGVRRFVDFQARLGVARNILTRRLAHLVEHGVLAAVEVGVHGSRHEYELTPRGKDLLTAITALRQWGDRWIFGPGHEPVVVLDRRTGRPLPRLRIVGEDGQPVPADAMRVTAGPGAGRPPARPTSGTTTPKAARAAPRRAAKKPSRR